jgi:hypothetical protein
MMMNKIDRQVEIAGKMQVSGYNVVTCGSCGGVNLHEMHQEEIECAWCDYKSEPCDFPDYFYEGMPEQTKTT